MALNDKDEERSFHRECALCVCFKNGGRGREEKEDESKEDVFMQDSVR